MNLLKKIFPYSFKEANRISDVVISALIYVIVCILAWTVIGVLLSIVSLIPVADAIIEFVLVVIGLIFAVYTLIGIAVRIWTYRVIKKN